MGPIAESISFLASAIGEVRNSTYRIPDRKLIQGVTSLGSCAVHLELIRASSIPRHHTFRDVQVLTANKPKYDRSISCSGQRDKCWFLISYKDLTGISGYLVVDQFYFDMSKGQSLFPDRWAPLLFGCSIHPPGQFKVDGIMGFGPGVLSVISQLSAQANTPKVFSHCLMVGLVGGEV
ncbi:hypothetical protein CRG98_045717 [Punica granatum]|uniref:Xylanase inhibitor N-terminal domain-containing protein n=1 Tax=Punica granatum TaxID=22663 RepID=A0A2I0HQA1_PUNGR|nr:hypothetical protein CRG98_045717 [Punica granatum]